MTLDFAFLLDLSFLFPFLLTCAHDLELTLNIFGDLRKTVILYPNFFQMVLFFTPLQIFSPQLLPQVPILLNKFFLLLVKLLLLNIFHILGVVDDILLKKKAAHLTVFLDKLNFKLQLSLCIFRLAETFPEILNFLPQQFQFLRLVARLSFRGLLLLFRLFIELFLGGGNKETLPYPSADGVNHKSRMLVHFLMLLRGISLIDIGKVGPV